MPLEDGSGQICQRASNTLLNGSLAPNPLMPLAAGLHDSIRYFQLHIMKLNEGNVHRVPAPEPLYHLAMFAVEGDSGKSSGGTG